MRKPARALALALTVGLLVAVPATAAAATAGGVRTEELRIDSGGQEPVSLDSTLYLPAVTPAPAVLVAHGFGGSKASVDADARDLAARGFVVLAWSARGFGTSTGTISLNAPGREVADARALVDWLAKRPEVLQDGPGDPRVGVTGGSYGGALSLLLAGYDKRVDALAPVITWNDLGQALFPNAATATPPPVDTAAHGAFAPDGVFKRGWAGIFFSAGLGPAGGPAGGSGAGTGGPNGIGATGSVPAAPPNAAPPNAAPPNAAPPSAAPTTAPPAPTRQNTNTPANGRPATSTPAPPAPPPAPPSISCGRFAPEVCAAYTEAATTGRMSPGTADLLRRSSPVTVAGLITAPTLIVQGEQDTLFGLDQADANARQIAAAGGPVKVVWFAGGHDGAAPDQAVRDAIGTWFDFHLAHEGADPGTGFDYTVQSGVRAGATTPTSRTVAASSYPGLPGTSTLDAQSLGLEGAPQVVLNPAGGNPAAITSLPGLGGALGSVSGRISAVTSELPGQSAQFRSAPLATPVLVAGSPRVTLTVARVPGQRSPAEAILFAKTYEVTADGQRSLLGSAVAPMRVAVPADGSPATVTVTLPGVVAPVEAGNRVLVSVSTTDQGFTGSAEPAVWRIGMDAAAAISIPVVAGASVTANTVPLVPLIGIGVVLVAALVAWAVATTIRRRRAARTRRVVDPAAPPLVISDLAKTYRGGFSAVKGVSFTVEDGMVLGLLGPNGAGKTTVLRMLMGLIRPTAGTITAFGRPVGPGAPVLAMLGAFVEGPGFLPHLSGADNLRLYWAATGRPTNESYLDVVTEIAGLGTSIERRVGTYSQGMRQRLAIAQAMLGLPDLLVLDEPTNGLDPPQIHAMRDVLQRYAESGRTVLISSHLLAEVEQTCTHVVVMHHGKVVADGTVEEIIAGGGAATFTVDEPDLAADVLGALDGVHAVSIDGSAVYAELNGMPRASAVRALVTAGVDVAAAGPRRRLEDAFLQLVGEDTAP